MARRGDQSPPSAEHGRIHALDFDRNRSVRSQASRDSRRSLVDEDTDFMGEVANEIIERDRNKMKTEVIRTFSFFCAVMSCLCAGSIQSFSIYGPRFLTDLHYTQLRINAVSITAELAMYLPVPFLGYLCDRYSPPLLSGLSVLLFGGGYLAAAYTYRTGPPADAVAGGTGWPFGIMILAFIGIGAGTSCMYLSAVATCAKNFATAKYRGLMLAVPIAAFGLSGMWQSQVGAHLLTERMADGRKGDVDVFRYFVFLAGTLMGVGVLGVLGLHIVDEEALIDREVEHLERSGLLEESEFFRNSTQSRSYGTVDQDDSDAESDAPLNLSASMVLKRQEESARLRRKKDWLLNKETGRFLSDRTMWLLAAGFFLLTGPGEAYINNLGTIIPSLTPKHYFDVTSPPAGLASTHVSIIALSSTFARLFTGSLSDIFAPSAENEFAPSPRITFSRLVLLLPSAVLLLFAFLNLALPFLTMSTPSLFLLSSAFLGLGYGASFSLVPIIISVVWGVENFATNWGVVAMMPAGGAAVWSIIYSITYSMASSDGGECVGYACFAGWAWGSSASVFVAIIMWLFAWAMWRRRRVMV